MFDPAVLAIFIPTFLFVSITPGMCMTLAMTMGITVGLRRSFWMMWGELVGVGFVAVASVVGVAAILLQYPTLFLALKYGGGAYLLYLGVELWRSRGRMALAEGSAGARDANRGELALQGLVTAIANPKAWAFDVALLPQFIDHEAALPPQLAVMLVLILVIEFLCLLVYASGGKTMRHFLQKSGNVRTLNRIAGTLMMGVGVWLALG